jgi:hypothetical protein
VSESTQQVAHPRRGDRQRATRRRVAQAQVEFALASGQALPRRGLQHLHPGIVMRGPEMLDLRHPRRDEYTICTAVAPDLVFTMRTYGKPAHPTATD